MIRMPTKRIIVRNGENPFELILKELSKDEWKYQMFFIEKALLCNEKKMKRWKFSRSQNVYAFPMEQYEIVLHGGDYTSEWYALWYIYDSNQVIYSLVSENLLDLLAKKCHGETVYVRRWGSKTEKPKDE